MGKTNPPKITSGFNANLTPQIQNFLFLKIADFEDNWCQYCQRRKKKDKLTQLEEVEEQIAVKIDAVDIKRECAAPAALLGRPTAPRVTKWRRRRQVLRDSMQSFTKNDIRRLARKAGVKRISQSEDFNHLTKCCLRNFLEQTIADTIVFTEHARRRTVFFFPNQITLRMNSRLSSQ
jgi:histone H3/H4